ncbi:MAG TPA: hypothetical protein VGA62_07640, partial [Acidimicrobiia bacterium]
MRVGDESGRARAAAIDPGLVVPESLPTPEGRGEWRRVLRRFRHHAVAMVGLGFLVVMFLACFVGSRFAPNPNDIP